MILFVWLSASLYLFARGIALLVKGVAMMLFYGVLLFMWACAMGAALPFRVVAALNQPRRRSA